MIAEILTTRLEDLFLDAPVRIENIEYVHGIYDWIVTFQTESLIAAKRYCE